MKAGTMECKVTYANFVCDIKTQKSESHRTRLTAGGNKLDYIVDPSAPSFVLLDTKNHLNSVISDPKKGARYFVADIKNYYLNNLLIHLQYMGIHTKYFTEAFRKEYIIYYAHIYPNATIRYHASDMCLHTDSDEAYLVQPQAGSRVAGHFYLSENVFHLRLLPLIQHLMVPYSQNAAQYAT